jgi:predicted nucleic acid-binding protein
MQNVIIADTSCLILLDKIEMLNLLHALYEKITITEDILREFNKEIEDWILIQNPVNHTYQSILEVSLDKGESSAIALAIEQKDSLLIIDDYKGRKYAEHLGLKITGTLGILIEAKRNGHIKSVKEILNKIKKTDFRLSVALEQYTLEKAGEN